LSGSVSPGPADVRTGGRLGNLPDEFLFSSCNFLAERLTASRATAIRVVHDDLAVRKDVKGKLSSDLTGLQKMESPWLSRNLLESLGLHDDTKFRGVATEDELWVYYGY
jgi:hypothetical protein